MLKNQAYYAQYNYYDFNDYAFFRKGKNAFSRKTTAFQQCLLYNIQ